MIPKNHRLLAALWLGLCAAGFAPAALLEEPGPALEAGHEDPRWPALFATLAAQAPVHSTFTEHRWFSVRKEPVVLQGEMRHSPELGLSLHYTEPEENQMIVDDHGLLLRDARGRTRQLKADPRAPMIDALLLRVLRFDEAALREHFELHAAASGAAWRLDFVARTPALARTVGRITVEGEGETVRRLEFRRGPKQRVEVLIRETRTRVTFTDEEKRRHFR